MNIPTTTSSTVLTFADDTAILVRHTNPETAVKILQEHVTKIEKWLQEKQIKANSTKCNHIPFTPRKQIPPNILLSGTHITQTQHVKYLFFLRGGNPHGHQATSGGGGSAGLQPTKTSTMTDPAAIKRSPGTGARDTPGPFRAQNASSLEPPYKAVGFPYRTAWRSRRADLSAPNFDPHRGKRRPWSALSKRARGVCHAPADRSSRGGNSAPSLFPLPPSEA